jgi:hypothetical protein
MTRAEIRDLFSRHQPRNRVDAALALLVAKYRAYCDHRDTGGRPSEVWFAKSNNGPKA